VQNAVEVPDTRGGNASALASTGRDDTAPPLEFAPLSSPLRECPSGKRIRLLPFFQFVQKRRENGPSSKSANPFVPEDHWGIARQEPIEIHWCQIRPNDRPNIREPHGRVRSDRLRQTPPQCKQNPDGWLVANTNVRGSADNSIHRVRHSSDKPGEEASVHERVAAQDARGRTGPASLTGSLKFPTTGVLLDGQRQEKKDSLFINHIREPFVNPAARTAHPSSACPGHRITQGLPSRLSRATSDHFQLRMPRLFV